MHLKKFFFKWEDKFSNVRLLASDFWFILMIDKKMFMGLIWSFLELGEPNV